MTKYHYAENGNIVVCKAKKRCRRGASFAEFTSQEKQFALERAAKYEVQHMDRIRSFTFGSSAKKAFTEGDCWRLAVELNSLTGWSLHAIAYTKQDSMNESKRSFAHVFVIDPFGNAVDIDGVHLLGNHYLKRYEMLPGWRDDLGQENHYMPLNSALYVKQSKKSWVNHPKFDAKKYAMRVLAQYQK